MIAVTGATGFIGLSLCTELEKRGYQLRKLVRTMLGDKPADTDIVVGQIDGATRWEIGLSKEPLAKLLPV